jgi:hypothetical protein
MRGYGTVVASKKMTKRKRMRWRRDRKSGE